MADNTTIVEARKRFEQAKTAWSHIRDEAAIDLRMVAGEQWDTKVKADRATANRPALTFNRLHTLVQQTSNRARQERPQPKVNPSDSVATQATAEVIEGHLRHIQYASQADVAYDNAVECSASCGFGYYRIKTEYIDDSGFNQEPRIRRILDPMTVYFDPSAQEPDFSDAEWCFVRQRMKAEEYRRRFKREPVSLESDGAPDWVEGEEVWIAEYWRVVKTPRKLQAWSDGTVGLEGDVTPGPNATVQQERTIDERTIETSIIDGQNEFEKTEWIGRWIPIVPVLGKESVVDGKRIFASLIRQARDPQKLLNAYKSGIAEGLGTASRAQFLGQTGIFKSQAWRNGSRPLYLEWDPINSAGQPSAQPQIIDHEPPVQALSQAAIMEADDLKASVGYNDSVLSPSRADLSGVAVKRRTDQADLTNFHFSDNLARSQWHCGRILVDLVQKLYDVPREIRTMQEDGTVGLVPIARQMDDGTLGYVHGREAKDHHSLEDGEYDVVVTTGPGYDTKRDEERQLLTAMIQADPAMFSIYGDLYFKLMGYGDLEERAKLALAPPIQQAISQKEQGGAQIPPQVQAVMAAQGQKLQALTGVLQKLVAERQGKVVETKSREQIALINATAGIAEAEIKAGHEQALALHQSEMQAIEQMLNMLHESELAPDPNAQPSGGGTTE